MEQRTMEIVLKYFRKKYNLSQEEICEGICSVTTLSRLEQGNREIDSLLGQTLLGRIGKEVTLFETMLNEADFELWKIRTEIEDYVEKNQFKSAKQKIRKYREVMPQEERIHEQFCLYQEALLIIAEKEPLEQLCKTLEKGIKITISDFGEEIDKKRLYSPIEIEMIFLLIHYDDSKENIAEQELLKILDYVEKYYSDRKKEKMGTKIFLELIRHQKRRNDYEKILVYTEEAIDFISRGTGFHHLADLYFLRAKTREKMFCEEKENQEWIRQSIEECELAYHLYEIEDNEKQAEEAAKFYEKLVQENGG